MRGIVSAMALGMMVAASPAIARGGISGSHYGNGRHPNRHAGFNPGGLVPIHGGGHLFPSQHEHELPMPSMINQRSELPRGPASV